MNRIVGIAVLLAAFSVGQIAVGSGQIAPARFADPDRRARLSTAFPRIDRVFRDFAERQHVPGIAYGIVVDGELVHRGAVGYRELQDRSAPDADTVFRIASMTKSFTALAILSLRDAGKLSLDDPAERYVPELAGLRYPSADSPRITIRHLLSHSEGFPEDNPWGDQQLGLTDEEMSEMMKRGIPFSNAPGLAYEYSNYGFAILGRIVARVSGMTYRDYVTAKILRPLGMTATTLQPSDVPASRLAHGYRWEDERWKEEKQLPDGAFGAMGGMLTSIRDLSRYVGFMMSAWPPRDDPDDGPVKRASVREMQQVWRMAPATVRRDGPGAVQLNAGGYGYGLRVWQTCGIAHSVAHSGGLPGFGSYMRWLPEHGVALIAFGNRTYTSWTTVAEQAFDLLTATGGLRPRTPQPSRALLDARDAVSQLILRWDDALAERIAAGNLFLDIAKERRRKELDALRARVGTCRASGPFDVENALRGQWTMACERGALRVAITLAPTEPPLVQHLSVQALEAGETPQAASTACIDR